MFSSLSSQVSSWVGAATATARGEHDEPVPDPVTQNTNTNQDTQSASASTQDQGIVNEAADPANPETTTSPTKTGSKLDMFTNVKSQMSGWLGSGIPIPGLRKTDSTATAPQTEGEAAEAPAEASQDPSAKDARDDDDNSRYISATGGADSRPISPAGTPTDEAAGQIGNVTHKAVAGAKSFGSFLYSAVNKAGAKVSEVGAKVKKTVEENTLLGEFNKEQDAFIRNQAGAGGPVELPWAGRSDEAALKEECLSLSTDRRNFVRAPPAGVEYNFDYDVSYPVAVAIMAEDPNLEKMRFDLVPKVITEENFWKNYFYRVSLICQASEASDANNESQPGSRLASLDDPQDEPGVVRNASGIEPLSVKEKVDKFFESTKANDLTQKNVEEEWETELEAELRDYEVLGGDKNTGDEKNWEKECQELLDEDEDDLK